MSVLLLLLNPLLAVAAPAAAMPHQAAHAATSFTIFFDAGTAALTPEAIIVLDTVADRAAEDQRLTVLVDGHAEGAGAKADSAARATAVRDYLIDHGVEAERITLTAHGDANPRLVAGQPLNDRAEIRLMHLS